MKLRYLSSILLFCGCNLIGGPTQETSQTTTDEFRDVDRDFVASVDLASSKIDQGDSGFAQPDRGMDLSSDASLDQGSDSGSSADVAVDVKPEDMGPPMFCQETFALSPVLYWSFDNSTGNDYPNVMGTGLPKAVATNTEVDTGNFQNGMKFNGRDALIAADHDGIFAAEEGTVALWFKKSGDIVCTDTTTGCGLFSKDAHGYGQGGHFTIAVTGESRLRIRLQSDDSTYQIDSSPLDLTAFHHLAVSFGGLGIRVFLDGMLIGTNAYTGGLDHGASIPTISNRESVGVGWSRWNAVAGTSEPKAGFFHGMIDEVLFFNRELVENEVRSLSDGCDD